jgi:hypothetical protein
MKTWGRQSTAISLHLKHVFGTQIIDAEMAGSKDGTEN